MPRRTAVRWESWRLAGRQTVQAAPLSPITFPASPLTVRAEIALGADPAADPSTWSWLDITRWVRYKPGIQITFGRRDESSRVEASQARLTLDNRDGRWSRRNPYGPYFGQLSKNTPIRIGVNPGDGVHYRYHGFVNEWPTRWSDKAATDSTVPIVCGGVLRRMQQGGRIKSAMFRTFSGFSDGDFVPIAYWPCEDGSGATTIASGLTAGDAARVGGSVQLAAYSAIPGSEPLPTIGSGGQISAAVRPYVSTGVWQFQWAMNIPSQPAATTYYLDASTTPDGGGGVRHRVFYNSVDSQLWIQSLNSSGTVLASGAFAMFYDQPFVYAITQFINVGSVENVLSQYTADGFFQQTNTFYAGSTTGNITGWSAYADANNAGFAFGHAAVYTDDVISSPNIGPNAKGMSGHAGEVAHERGVRLCREAGIPFYCTSAHSATMGPQTAGTLLDNLRACESADGGVLYEHEFGLGYQSLDDRLNAPVQLALDFDSRHVADTPEPADDDQKLTNRVTVTRSGGSSSIQQDDDSIAESGVFETSASLNLYADSQAAEAASWRVWLGTVDEDRWPAIPIRLHGTPDLIGPWTSLPYGSRMTLANPPDEMAPDMIDAVVEGWSETIRPRAWDASLNTTPASPYQVGRVADESGDTDLTVGWAEADSCALAADVSTTDTSWSVNTTPLASTDPDDAGFRMRWGGEVIYVNSITGGSNPQTWDVDRSINGVVIAHLAGTTGELVNPVIPVP